jgi:hypothetical protein
LIAAAVVIATLLLGRLLTSQQSADDRWMPVADSIAMAAVLVMSIPPTRTAMSMGQTTPILCCFMILVLLSRGSFSSGIAASMSALVKPLAAIPALVLLLGKRWPAVIAAILTGCVLLVTSIVIFGTDDWASYLRQEYATAAPAWIYYEPINQSLLATLCRAFGLSDVPWANLPVVLTYTVLSTIICLPSFWLAAKITRVDFSSAYCLLLLAALLVYPGTQITYGMLLSIPMAIELRKQIRSRTHEMTTLLFLATTIVLFGLGLFAVNVFVWMIFVRRAIVIYGTERNKNTDSLLAKVGS